MGKTLFKSHLIDDRSQLAFIKREIHNTARIHFGETRTGEIDIVLSEMLSNIIKYATRGELLFRLDTEGEQTVLEVICIDDGPGMKDVPYSSKDGISSKSTLGHGLGSITRLSSFSQIYSQPGWGTIVYSKFINNAAYVPSASKILVRSIEVAIPGEIVSGDGISIRALEDKVMIFAGDGLGHGPHAKDAIDKAVNVFQTSTSCDPCELLREINKIKKSRGLVATVAVLDLSRKKWEICGIGNIHTRLQKGLEFRNYLSYNGIVSVNIPTRMENALWEMEKFQMMIFCSDGIKTRWDLVRYPGILKFDPIIVAAAIYKDHARRTDDMTVLIVKIT